MKAWQWTACPETLEKALFINDKAELPTAKKPLSGGEVLVRVHYAALNPVDWKIQTNGIIVTKYPAVLGTDATGVVKEVGEDVTAFAVGDRVYVFLCRV